MNPLETFFGKYTHTTFKKGERILREHEQPTGVFYLKKGVVRLYLLSEEGNELTVLMHGEGNVFPLRWALLDQPNIYYYQALTDVEVLRAPQTEFQKYVLHTPEAGLAIQKQLVLDGNALIYRLQHVVFGNARAKVAAVVLTAAKQLSSTNETGVTEVSVPLTHQQIADTAGITRETASLEMKKLKEEGVIDYHGRSLSVLDLDALEALAFL